MNINTLKANKKIEMTINEGDGDVAAAYDDEG